ncbi:hypothetical protein F5Y07DRAFT_344154 [Xylaria sp. FL0933]|nr:hypothetical protein F5Y07DRAFT_344154 [Xylaria sp. FL0933]
MALFANHRSLTPSSFQTSHAPPKKRPLPTWVNQCHSAGQSNNDNLSDNPSYVSRKRLKASSSEPNIHQAAGNKRNSSLFCSKQPRRRNSLPNPDHTREPSSRESSKSLSKPLFATKNRCLNSSSANAGPLNATKTAPVLCNMNTLEPNASAPVPVFRDRHCAVCHVVLQYLWYECQECADVVNLCASCRPQHPGTHELELCMEDSGEKTWGNNGMGPEHEGPVVADGNEDVRESILDEREFEDEREPEDEREFLLEEEGTTSPDATCQKIKKKDHDSPTSTGRFIPSQIQTQHSSADQQTLYPVTIYFTEEGLVQFATSNLHIISNAQQILNRLHRGGKRSRVTDDNSLEESSPDPNVRVEPDSGIDPDSEDYEPSSDRDQDKISSAHKSRKAVRKSRRGDSMNRSWCSKEKRQLEKMKRRGRTDEEIGERLGRSAGAVMQQWRKQKAQSL